MAISSALNLAEKIDAVATAIETGQAFTDSDTAIEVTATLAQIAGVTAVGGLVSAAGRFTDPMVRLSALISGNREALRAKGWLSGLVVAEALSRAIDEFNKRGYGADIIEGVVTAFNRAKKWLWPRDPIILDLDGDGLETVGLASNIHFDYDGDGVLTRTGWVGEHDALLVWDRNANGSIDTGAELFGDFTVLPNGTLAPNGFAALAALDANSDGILDATDPAFSELKLWRDASQDGHTGEGELITLADAGIVSLNLANILKNQRLANGNTLSREGGFTRTDGTTGGMGEFRLSIDTFHTQFAEQIEVPELLKTLPNMGGSGNVRELWQAAAQSASVASVLAQFQAAPTRAEQQALLDQLLTAWSDTSGMAKSLDERAEGALLR